jgi:hypothetical protein
MRLKPRWFFAATIMTTALWALPGSAGDASPDSVPAVGTVAPAFGLYAFPTSGSLKKAVSQDREVVQLDDLCGLRPGKTQAVVVLFVDGDVDILAADPVGNWYRKYHKDGLEVVVVSVERNPSEFAAKVLRAKPRYPILDDRHRVVARRYGVSDAPFSFLLNSECRVLGFDHKSAPEAAAELTAAIEELVRGRMIQDDEGDSR